MQGCCCFPYVCNGIKANAGLHGAGSPEFLLSGKLATLLSGQYGEFQRLPISLRTTGSNENTMSMCAIVPSHLPCNFSQKKAGEAGHILENFIYLELLRRGYTVNIGKTLTSKIDFVTWNSHGSFA